jgi:hypothetical protein
MAAAAIMNSQRAQPAIVHLLGGCTVQLLEL